MVGNVNPISLGEHKFTSANGGWSDKGSATKVVKRLPKPVYKTKVGARVVLTLIGTLGLAMVILPYLMSWDDELSVNTHRRLLFVGLVFWAIAAVFWKKNRLDDPDMLD